jgi:hypothetical protein
MKPCSLVNNYIHIKLDCITFHKIIMFTFIDFFVYRAIISIKLAALFGKRKVKHWTLILELPWGRDLTSTLSEYCYAVKVRGFTLCIWSAWSILPILRIIRCSTINAEREKINTERAKKLSIVVYVEINNQGHSFCSPIMQFQVSLKRINEEGSLVTEMECVSFGVEVNKPVCICNNMGFSWRVIV